MSIDGKENGNCCESDCPACLGSIETLAPAYDDSTNHDKDIWFNCRQAAFKAADACFQERSIESMQDELATNMTREAEITAIVGKSGGAVDIDHFEENMDDAVRFLELKMEHLKLMFERMDLNRHIKWKLGGGIPEDAYRENAIV